MLKKWSKSISKHYFSPLLAKSKNPVNFASSNGLSTIGEVLEWLKRYAWKAYIPLKGIESSNLFLSADNKQFKR